MYPADGCELLLHRLLHKLHITQQKPTLETAVKQERPPKCSIAQRTMHRLLVYITPLSGYVVGEEAPLAHYTVPHISSDHTTTTTTKGQGNPRNALLIRFVLTGDTHTHTRAFAQRSFVRLFAHARCHRGDLHLSITASPTNTHSTTLLNIAHTWNHSPVMVAWGHPCL